jgi:malic enzyme
MEGKVALFKRFADIDGIDLEIGTEDVDEFVNACATCAASAASTWKTSRRRNASSSSSGCAS